MIRRGVTACYDLSVEIPSPSVEGIFAVARAYADAGIRAVVAPMLADTTLYHALPGLLDAFPEPARSRYAALAATPWQDSLRICREAYRAWPFDRRRIRPGIAPTIPLHCSDDFLRACGTLAIAEDLRLQTHLAETKSQAVLGLRKYGRSLTAHLGSLGLITERLSAAHAVWIDDDDIARLADGGARVAHNPMSNLRLGSGVAPLRAMRDRGLPVGIGTDGSNTSDGQNMFEATRLAAYLSRLDSADAATWVSAAEALQMATAGSADLLGFTTIGRLAPGFEADIVFLGLDAPHLVPFRAPLLQTVFGENGASIRRVMVGGRTIFLDGKLLTLDEAHLRREAEAAAHRLDSADAAAIASESVAAFIGTFCSGLGCTGHPVQRNFVCVSG